MKALVQIMALRLVVATFSALAIVLLGGTGCELLKIIDDADYDDAELGDSGSNTSGAADVVGGGGGDVAICFDSGDGSDTGDHQWEPADSGDLVDADDSGNNDEFDSSESDTNTGDNEEGIWPDPDTALTWQNPGSDMLYTWQEAVTYCEQLTLAGYTDWRLPTMNELRTLADGCPTIAPGGDCSVGEGDCTSWSCRNEACYACAPMEGPDEGCYWTAEIEDLCDSNAAKAWSATLQSDNNDYAWYVNYLFGNITTDSLTNYQGARCVR